MNILQRIVNLVRRFRDAQSCFMSGMLDRSDNLNLLLYPAKVMGIDILRGCMFHCEIVDLGINSLYIKTCRQLQVSGFRQQYPLENGKRTAYTVKRSTKSAS